MSKKITFLLTNLKYGGIETNTLRLIKYFIKKNYKVDLVIIDLKGGLISQIPAEVNLIDLNRKKAHFSIFAMRKYLKENNPDYLISAKERNNVLSYYSIKFAGVNTKLIASVRTQLELEYNRKMSIKSKILKFIDYSMAKHIYDDIDYLVAVSKGVKDNLKSFFNLKRNDIKVIYNPVVTEDIDLLKDEEVHHKWFNNEQIKVVIGVGRLSPPKNFLMLLKAFSKAVNENNNLRLAILGDGPTSIKNELEEYISKNNLNNKVDLLGFVENPYKYVNKASIFVLSSSWEGFGNVVAEALAVGTPVVSTNCPSGPEEILDDGKYGSIVPVNDHERLAEEILNTLSTSIDSKELIKRSKKFSVEESARGYLDIIEN